MRKNSPCLGDCDSLCLNYCITSVSWTATFPNYQDQTEELIKQFPSFWKSTLQTVQEFMAKTPFAKDLESANESINQLWGKLANSFKDFAGDYLQTGAQGLGSVFSAVSSTFLTLFTGPIIAFFPF